MNNLKQMRNKLEQLKGRQAQVLEDIADSKVKTKSLKINLRRIERAKAIIQVVAQKTQQKLEYRISELATLAMAAVFANPYALVVGFEIKRSRTEATIAFQRGDSMVNPLDATGGGAIDVASFALRITGWGLQKNKTRPIFILDEPFKHLKGIEENERVIQMIKNISDKLGIQVLMVSDERVPIRMIQGGADKVLNVGIKKGVSKVVGVQGYSLLQEAGSVIKSTKK